MKCTTLGLKKYVVLTCIGFGLLVACGEKKKTEAEAEKIEMEAKAKAEENAKKEAMEKAEAIKKAEAEEIEKARMKADSIRQVKEHGHAH
ncbi:hypothetical protein [Spongiimicrobium salis]|uniref:hypothetical protein n=1 Tax=Spongiimicrobium salis TaxID=1667022 RepID=UPI00374DC292